MNEIRFGQMETIRSMPVPANCHFRLLIALMAMLILAACAGNYGRLQRSSDVSKIFERHELLPDHRYYATGSEASPKAILAVHPSYSLKPGLWRPMTMTPELLARLVDAMTDQLGFSLATMGAVIFDPEGKPAGAWYSQYSHTTVRFEPDNVIVVSLPSEKNDPFIMNRGRRSGRPY